MPSNPIDPNANKNPFAIFENWLNTAALAGEKAPEAMTVATANKKGFPSARILLLKHFDEKGFVFYTNSNSRKGIELNENPLATLLFFWKTLDRQVRIEGSVSLISPDEADAYFKTRPHLSKVGAHISSQSSPLKSWETLEAQLEAQKKLYKVSENVPRPNYWNGYRVNPSVFEFWEAKPFRLHHRVQFHRKMDIVASLWEKELLYP
ncbi:pyridoxamine 5'-phosphate oxidase [Acetobacteraceae bacterium]|nr:pyridoxamine 5'-phosphate oxidase [Acetobacteraceae bacterium]